VLKIIDSLVLVRCESHVIEFQERSKQMTTPLRLLLIEDSEDDALLLMRELSKGSYDLYSERVDTAEAMEAALSARAWDLVISDFVMPHFSGLDALQMLRESGIDIPFIIVSGKIGEETAVDAMKAGADDYILKGNLARLAPAVKRELADAEVRRKCRQADEEIKLKGEEILAKQLELDAQRLRYEELYNLAPVGYLTLSAAGLILEANLAAANMLGMARRALVKLSICRFISQEDQDIYYLQRKKCFDSVNPQAWEMRLVRTDGFTFWAHLQATPAKNSEYWIALADITERKKAEEEKLAMELLLQEAQKLESLGVLSGGIAHDFNNILAIILGHCYLAKQRPDAVESSLARIERAVERAAELCRQMLAYAGKAPFEQSQVKMTILLNEMTEMCKSTIPRNVQIKLDCPADIPPIMGDIGQLNQIVMNLLINASEAIGDAQGEIRISLAKTEIKDETTDKDHLGKNITPGCYLCLEVADTGCGMDVETRQRIFEPFYTTKFSGRGLGMSAVLGIVTAHMGALQISSHLGQGTTFKVYLPVHIDEFAKDAFFQEVVPVEWTGSGTVLLVEDEEMIRFMASAMLEELGFTVIAASNGREALELYQKNAAGITLVITDIGMPVMDGYELIAELKKLNRKLPIIVSSGFGDSVVTSRMAREDIAGLLNKPYRFDKLREVLRGVVEGGMHIAGQA